MPDGPEALVLGGIIALLMGADTRWEYKIALILLPTIIYGILMLFRKFPVNERVQAGVSYKEMLQEVGAIGALMIVSLIVFQLGAVFALVTYWFNIGLYLSLVTILIWTLYKKPWDNPCFIILLLIMIPLGHYRTGYR